MRHSEYTTYFRTIAQLHTDFRHREPDEESDGEIHFARIVLERDEFGNTNLDEFMNALRSRIKFPFMLLEAYGHEYEDNVSDNFKKRYNGAFIILDQPESDAFDHVEQVYDRTEALGEEILGYCIADFARNLHFRRFFVQDCSGEKIANVAGLYGTRFNFSFTQNANQNLRFNPEKFYSED